MCQSGGKQPMTQDTSRMGQRRLRTSEGLSTHHKPRQGFPMFLLLSVNYGPHPSWGRRQARVLGVTHPRKYEQVMFLQRKPSFPCNVAGYPRGEKTKDLSQSFRRTLCRHPICRNGIVSLSSESSCIFFVCFSLGDFVYFWSGNPK